MARRRVAAHLGEIMDGRDLLVLAERDLVAPLDARAKALASAAARRVSVVTAVSPRAFFDVAFVLFESVRLIRRIAAIYGGRPGTLGLFRLMKAVVSHLAVTGSIAVGDTLLQQFVGHGLAGRLSAKLGEGVVNGLMTARIGLSAMDVCRPLPFLAAERPRLKDLAGNLVSAPARAMLTRRSRSVRLNNPFSSRFLKSRRTTPHPRSPECPAFSPLPSAPPSPSRPAFPPAPTTRRSSCSAFPAHGSAPGSFCSAPTGLGIRLRAERRPERDAAHLRHDRHLPHGLARRRRSTPSFATTPRPTQFYGAVHGRRGRATASISSARAPARAFR